MVAASLLMFVVKGYMLFRFVVKSENFPNWLLWFWRMACCSCFVVRQEIRKLG